MTRSRYITIELSHPEPAADCEVVAYHETENWQALIESGAWHEYVWQFADTPEQAIQNHDAKWLEWRDDVNSGRTAKDTY